MSNSKKLKMSDFQPCSRAILKNIFASPRKMNEVVKLIRGKNSKYAMGILSRCSRSLADHVYKLLGSAIANSGYIEDSYIIEAIVGRGSCAKRIEFKGRGKTGMRSKYTCYIKLVLGTKGVEDGSKG